MIKLKSVLEAKKRKKADDELHNIDDILLYGLIAYLDTNKTYVSKTKAEVEGKLSTANKAEMLMADPSQAQIVERYKSEAEQLLVKLKTWLKDFNFDQAARNNYNLSDYYYKLQNVFRHDVARTKDFGYVVSIISFFLKYLEIEEINKDKKSEFVGEVGQTVVLDVIIKQIKDINTQYGLSVLVSMEDEDGNDLIWFAKPNEINTNKINKLIKDKTMIRINGTVSKHEISKFTNLKQTGLKKVNLKY